MEEVVIMDNRKVVAEALRAIVQACNNDEWDVLDGEDIESLLAPLALLLETDAPVELEELLDNVGISKDNNGEYVWKWWEE